MNYSLSFCYPAYNEEENIAESVSRAVEVCQKLFDNYEIIVTDDGSSDRTGEIVLNLAKNDPHIKLIQQENQGYGGSVWTALTSASKDLVFFTDADLQFDLSEIEKLLPYAENFNVVIGYRAPRTDPLMRKVNARLWTALVNLLLGLRARDLDCAFKLFHRKMLDGLKINSRGAAFSAELLWRLKERGAKIKQVPVKHLPRLAGKPTGANLKVIKKAFRELKPLVKEKRTKNKLRP